MRKNLRPLGRDVVDKARLQRRSANRHERHVLGVINRVRGSQRGWHGDNRQQQNQAQIYGPCSYSLIRQRERFSRSLFVDG